MTPGTTHSARWPAISKDAQAFPVSPNLTDYETACSRFSWTEARAALSGLPNGGLNIAYEAVDRHATGPRANHQALRFIRADGSVHALSYAELSEQTN
jgi:acetyl-CoA synthetase